jgi:hypothetical protein
MMIPLDVVNGYDLTLDSLSTAALADLRALLSGLEDVSPERSKAVLFEAFPEVFNPYAASSSAVSASFYEEVRDLAGVSGSFDAETLDTVDTGRWNSLVGAGTAPRMLEQGAANLMFQFLAGGLTSILSSAAADTMYGNALNDPAAPRYQRVPKPGCCGFCGMLASRGAVYSSEAAASGVAGRGVPVGEGRGRGSKGRGRGIKARGARSIGEKFHDHCKCRAVQVYAGNEIEMQANADKYLESYAAARNKISDGLTLESVQFKASDGSLKNKYQWVNADGKQVTSTDKTKMIATAIRHDLEVK